MTDIVAAVDDVVVAEVPRGGRGGSAAVDAIYDYYAEDLYDYCLTFLEAEEAADALHDALLVALAWAGRLEHPDEFALWLYALVRNECLRLLRRRGGTPVGRGAHGGEADGAAHTLDQRGPQILREVYDLIHRHAFEPREVGRVLGVPPNRAETLCYRAEAVLGQRKVIVPSKARRTAPLPPDLRARVLASAAIPSRVAYRGELAEPRRRSGYPIQLDQLCAYRRKRAFKAAGVAAAALVVAGVALAVPTSSRETVIGLLGAQKPASETTVTPDVLASPRASATGQPSADPTATDPSGQRTSPPTWSPLPNPPSPVGSTGAITGIGSTCLTVVDARGGAGSAIEISQCDNQDDQRWTVAADNTIRALGKCLALRNDEVSNGSEVQLAVCDGGPAQRWQHEKTGALLNPQSGRCLEAPSLLGRDDVRLVIWQCSGAENQSWQLP